MSTEKLPCCALESWAQWTDSIRTAMCAGARYQAAVGLLRAPSAGSPASLAALNSRLRPLSAQRSNDSQSGAKSMPRGSIRMANRAATGTAALKCAAATATKNTSRRQVTPLATMRAVTARPRKLRSLWRWWVKGNASDASAIWDVQTAGVFGGSLGTSDNGLQSSQSYTQGSLGSAHTPTSQVRSTRNSDTRHRANRVFCCQVGWERAPTRV